MDQKGTKIHSFIKAIEQDWDVEDEGPMHDILGIEVNPRSNANRRFRPGPDGQRRGRSMARGARLQALYVGC